MGTPTAPNVSTPPAPTAPAIESTAIDLDAMRAARAKGENPYKAPEPDATPDPEVEADPELRKEIDEVEKPKPEETPAEKAARTKRHKEAAIKQRITKLAKARDEHKTARETAERERDELRARLASGQPAATTVPQSTPKAGETPTSETRPKPTLKDFPLEKFKDEEDPYSAQTVALAEAVADWKWDEKDTAARASRQREQADDRQRTLEKQLDASEAAAKVRYADYDAVVGAARFNAPLSEHQAKYIRQSIAESGVYADLWYHLCKTPDRLNAILAIDRPQALDWALGAEIAEVKAALRGKETPAAPHRVNAVPEPVQPVNAGAGTGAILRNPLKDEGTSIDLDEVRKFRRAGGR